MLNSDYLEQLKNNEAWWERLSINEQRTSSKDKKVKIFAMTCGWMTSDMDMMLAGKPGKIRFPVPAYLIDHPAGQVLFDTGLHPQCQHDPHARIGYLADIFHVEYRKGEDIAARLEALDIDAGRIEYIVNSHLHFDHTGGNELIPNAKIIIQKREWEAGRIPELIQNNAFDPKDYDHGHLIQQVDGEHDLFGDGRITTVPTHGHTPGHQSLRVRLDSGEVILSADACYLRESIENLHLPRLIYNRSEMINSMLMLRKLQRGGAQIFYGHDPDFWNQVPQAPFEIV